MRKDSEIVGWVDPGLDPGETHHSVHARLMGFLRLNPSYELRDAYPAANNPRYSAATCGSNTLAGTSTVCTPSEYGPTW